MIFRSKPTTNYTVLTNEVIEDHRLDWRDLGLLIYLLSKPPHWKVSVSHLANTRKPGRDQIYKMLGRLRDVGYATLNRKVGGQTDWYIHDTPAGLTESPHPENTDTPHHEIQDTEIETLVSNDLLVSNDKDTPIAPKGACPHQEIISIYHEQLPELPKITVGRWAGSRDAKQLQARWNEDTTHQHPEFWRGFFVVVRTNPHWMGENDRGWKADFRWLVKRSSFDKVIDRWTNMETQG